MQPKQLYMLVVVQLLSCSDSCISRLQHTRLPLKNFSAFFPTWNFCVYPPCLSRAHHALFRSTSQLYHCLLNHNPKLLLGASTCLALQCFCIMAAFTESIPAKTRLLTFSAVTPLAWHPRGVFRMIMFHNWCMTPCTVAPSPVHTVVLIPSLSPSSR